ncbi:MAG: ACT domain-containing protein [Candidatus Micrarchaeota archaeon]
MAQSISEAVCRVLESRPYMLCAIEEGYANHSEIARLVGEDLKKQGVRAGAEALRAAVRRFCHERTSSSFKRSQAISRLLCGSKLELKTKLAVVVLSLAARIPTIPGASLVHGPSGVTLVLPQDSLPELYKHVRGEDILLEKKDLAALSVVSAENIEVVPGVVAFLSSTLSENGVNIREFLSSYRDTVMVVERRDALKAFSLLERLLH